MALVFSEEFETTIGNPPVGWTVTNGSPLVVAGGYHNHGCSLTPASVLYHTLPATYASPTAFFVVKMQGEGNASNYFSMDQTVVTTTGTVTNTAFVPMFNVAVVADKSLAVTDGAGVILATGIAAFSYKGEEDVFTFIQVDADLTNTTIGTASAIKVVATLRLNGENIGNGTSTFLSNLVAKVDTVFLEAPNDIGCIDDSIYIYDSHPATPIQTPNQGTNIHARVSQGVVEWAGLPSQPKVRVSQGVIEWPGLPSNPNVRVSQAVIELIQGQGGGWTVYEA